ncbi:MAG: DUF2797 domain-containing protein [Flavobacteriaceae bacterium]|jgi:hypothetical protein
MMLEGPLRKMRTQINDPIDYYMTFPSVFVRVNDLIGKSLSFTHTGFSCMSCGIDQPIFRQGFCKSCFFEMPSAGDWIMRPELSQAHLDIEDRDLAYEKKVQLQPHIVYLAVSSGLKVGVTRKTQVPTRWIDQGAHQTIPIVEVPNRYLAGITEVALKSHYNDKTNWRLMLTQKPEPLDLEAERKRALSYLPNEVKDYASSALQEKTMSLHFPLQTPPTAVKSINLTKLKQFSATLEGVKGQYLIFSDQQVMNVRGHEGVCVSLTVT